MIVGSWQNKFYIGNKEWHMEFDKYNQELFSLIQYHDTYDNAIYITTGPGSFVGTRSVCAFVLGYIFYTNKSLYGFNILLDILPYYHNIHNKDRAAVRNILYVYGELNRFFYGIFSEDLSNKNYKLFTKEEVDRLCEDQFTVSCGNYEKCQIYYDINYGVIKNTIDALISVYGKERFLFNSMKYCDKFKESES